MEAKPWTGETLKAGKKLGGVPKMAIFKDEVRPARGVFPHTYLRS